MKPRGRLALLLAVVLGACDLDVRSRAATAQDRVPPSGAFTVSEIREVCRDGSPPLEPVRLLPLPETVNRILPRDGALLMVGESGLLRWDGTGWTRVMPGRDFAFRADTILRLKGESLELLTYDGGRAWVRARSLPARGHDSSLDVIGSHVYVHSTVDPSGVLLTARSIADGRVTQDLLEVERNFIDLFLNDFDQLLQDASLVRTGNGRVALVPMLRNPISIFDTASRRRLDLHSPAHANGSVRSVRRRVLEDEQECPTCTRRVRERHDTRYERIHADAVFGDRMLWVLGSEDPGSRRVSVYRFRLDAPDRIEAFRLADLDTPPRALALSGDSLIVASEEHLYWFELPRRSAGADCDR